VQPYALNRIPIEILRARVAGEIRAAILRGDLPPGSRVKQEDLAGKLGVSREPVRQALLLLQREGLVQAKPNRGALVAPLDRELISDVYGLREAVETTVVAMLARRPDFDIEPSRAIIDRGRAAAQKRDLPALIDLDMSFHIGLYEASGNRVIVDLLRAQWTHMRRLMSTVLDPESYRESIWDEHEAIVTAIKARRVVPASALAGRHVREAKRFMLGFLDLRT
jgi:DNA-binding GntR family transcriptional regulator